MKRKSLLFILVLFLGLAIAGCKKKMVVGMVKNQKKFLTGKKKKLL